MKCPPFWVEQIGLDFQKNLIDGYLAADGHIQDGRSSITSVYLDGLYSAKRILARLGIVGSITVSNRNEYERVFPNGKVGRCRKSWQLGWSGKTSLYAKKHAFIENGYLWSKIRSVSDAEEAVFIPIMTETHEYQTAFGKSHNCDYHQLFMDNRKSSGMTERAMAVSREFKLLAVSNNIPIIDITAATQSDVSDQDAPPMLNQVAWSKAIEYDADMALAVHRHTDTNVVEMISRKNRHGTEFGMFVEVDFGRGLIKETFEMPS
jgi:hypothetical protein